MRECKRHPSESQPGGGVCASCLEERLTWLWRGESFRHDDTAPLASTTSTTSTSLAVDDVAQPKLLQQRLPDAAASRPALREPPEPSVAAPSLASVRQQLEVLGVASRPDTARSDAGVSAQNGNHGGDTVSPVTMAADPTPANSKAQNSTAIIEEWAAFHARRRGNAVPELELELESPKTKSSKSFDSIESLTENGARPVRPNPELRILMNAQKMRSQSMPLDFRSAEETAARVINEQAGDYLDEELEIYEVRDGGGGGEAMLQEHEVPRCFSPVWHSPKWVKVLASPMTSRNRVFPSRSKDTDVRKRSRSKRGSRFDSSDWGFKEANGGSSPLWREADQGMQQRSGVRTRSVFSWLQDAETTQYKKRDQTEQLTSSSSSSLTNSVSTDSWLRDLTTVGHLHEIAEELEIVEESSEEEEDDEEEEEEPEDLGNVSSFGKFLLQAAQRHPNARLTRLVSAPASQGL